MWIAAMALCARGTLALLDDPTVVVFAARDASAVVDGVAAVAVEDDGRLFVNDVELEAVAVGVDRAGGACRAGRWRVKPGPRTRSGLRAALVGAGEAKEFARGVLTFADRKAHAISLFVQKGRVTIASDFAHGAVEPLLISATDTSWLFAVGEVHGDMQQRLWLTFPVPYGGSVIAALAAKGKLTVAVGEYLHEEAHRQLGEAVLEYVKEVP